MSSEDRFDAGHVRQDVTHLAARGGAILVAGQGVQFLLGIATTVILARLLAPDDFGLVAMVAPLVGFLAFFRDSGLHMATVVQREGLSHRQVSTLFWLNLGLGFVLMILLALISPAVARFFGRGELAWIGIAYAVNMLIGGASIQHSALLTRQLAFGKLTTAAIASQVMGLVVAIVGAWGGLGYWALVAMALATTLTQCVLLWRMSGWAPGPPSRGNGVRAMLAFGGGLTLSNLFNQAAQYADTLVIGRILGAAQLGYYDRGKQLFLMPLLQLMAPLANVSIPALSRVDGAARYAGAYLRIQEKLLIVTALMAVFLAAYGDVIVLLLLGPRWSPVGPVLQALAIGGLVVPVSSSVSWLLVTQARSRDLAWWSPFSLMFRCVALFSGYPWGIHGIAISIALFQYLSFISFVLWVGRKGPVTAMMVLRNMMPSVLAGVAAYAVALTVKAALAESPPLASLAVGAIAVAVGYIATLWFIPSGRSAMRDAVALAKAVIRRTRAAGEAT